MANLKIGSLYFTVVMEALEPFVKMRTCNNHSSMGSHVMEYGTKGLKSEDLYLYQGSSAPNPSVERYEFKGVMDGHSQRWDDIWATWQKISGEYRHRAGVDIYTQKIALLLFGQEEYPSIINAIRGLGLPVVDDWNCLKSTVHSFETHCGSLSQYGVKFMRAFANICNYGATSAAIEVIVLDLGKWLNLVIVLDLGKWNPKILGYSA